MLSIQEVEQIQEILKLIHPEESKKKNINLDVSNRLRDEKGRFLPNESNLAIEEELPSELERRPRKVIKIKGSYNSYLIKDRWFTDGEIDTLIVFGIFGVLAIIIRVL